MGRPKKPSKVKALSLTEKRCRMNTNEVEFDLIDSVPAAPDWLPNGHAVREFERLAPILMANKLLTEPVIQPLAHLCALHGKIIQMWTSGMAPSGHLMSQYRNLVNDFGLTPVAQSRIDFSSLQKPRNSFSKHRRRML